MTLVISPTVVKKTNRMKKIESIVIGAMLSIFVCTSKKVIEHLREETTR